MCGNNIVLGTTVVLTVDSGISSRRGARLLEPVGRGDT